VAEAVDPPTPERREIAILDADGVRTLLQVAARKFEEGLQDGSIQIPEASAP